EIRELTRVLSPPEARTPENVSALITEFRRDLTERMGDDTARQFFDRRFNTAQHFQQIQQELYANIDNPEVFEKVLKKLKALTTRAEREFMGI
ncbi:MAG TPA: hypothetical protein PL110_06900, partial [Candidatus Eremiobacteraeota bacterium]|nr:hypothetical protein [Candidatus Eremiobacteraeota bacterium]